jgi:inward rectifier potassium channel
MAGKGSGMGSGRRRRRPRRINFGGRVVLRHGLDNRFWQDLYHLSMTASWPRFLGAWGAAFLLGNLVFSVLYHLVPGCIANLNPPGYLGAFFFSVETLATVGYGDMHPLTTYAHIVSSIEIFLGLTGLALVTGVMFARFSRPSARFLFARLAVVHPMDGQRVLMLRAANARGNIVMEASAQLRLIRDASTREGYALRRVEDLPLVRSEHPLFVMGWNLMHVIDAASPLHGEDSHSLTKSRAVLNLTLSGWDETTGQQLMARHAYDAAAIRWDHTFVDILTLSEEGVDHFDYSRFHDVLPLPAAGGARKEH